MLPCSASYFEIPFLSEQKNRAMTPNGFVVATSRHSRSQGCHLGKKNSLVSSCQCDRGLPSIQLRLQGLLALGVILAVEMRRVEKGRWKEGETEGSQRLRACLQVSTRPYQLRPLTGESGKINFPLCRLERPWLVCRGKQKRTQDERLRDSSSIRRPQKTIPIIALWELCFSISGNSLQLIHLWTF